MALPVFDGHNDVLLEQRSFADRSEDGHLDLARARAGGFAGGFFAIFTPHPDVPDAEPQPPVEHEHAVGHTFRAMRKLLDLERAGALRIAREPEELTLGDDVVAVMHVEGAEAVDPGLELLPALHAFGLRSLGITWSRPNAFGDGVGTDHGLTAAGRALVRGCEELGILVDLSHLSRRGFWDVAEISGGPRGAAPAGAAARTPHPPPHTHAHRDAVGESGGVVGVCFHFEHAGPQRTDIARHAHYIAERIGPEHVALGSDFDGCELPAGIRGAQDLPLVLDDLRALGWGEPELRLLAHENFLRVLRQVQNAASSRASPTGSS